MKIKLIVLSLILLMTGILQADATQLPKEMRSFFRTQKMIPSIRYDGLVYYGPDIMYLPVIPAYPKNVDKVEIVQTYPAKQKMEKLPDVIVFNNNYSLIKIFRTGENSLSVKNQSDWPEQIKTGLIPQDLMVPRGLTLPESLAGILGDVQIPLIGSAKMSVPTFISGKNANTLPLPTGKKVKDNKKYTVPEQLKNKLFFVNNFQTEYLEVFSSTVSEPLYSLKTSGVMKDVKPVLNGKYLLVATNNQKNIDVIDVEQEYIVKHIDLTANPSEIAVDEQRGKAYVASVTDESLFIIDLATMTVKEKIQLVGAPQCLSVSPDGKQIAYEDMKTSNIYVLELENEFGNKLVTNYPNTSKIILKNNVMYLIARTVPKLRIVSFDLLQDNKTTKTKKDKKRDKLNAEANKEDMAEAVTEDIFTTFDYVQDADNTDAPLLDEGKMYATSITDVSVGNKPIDMYEYLDKIYVLCAGDNSVYSVNPQSSVLSKEELPVGGFSKAFTRVPNSNLAIVTNMADYKYVVYDLDKEKAVETIPISEHINTITVLERANGQ